MIRTTFAALLLATSAHAACTHATPQLCDPTQDTVMSLGIGQPGTAQVINDAGVVAGTQGNGGFRWTQGTGPQTLLVPKGTTGVEILGINKSGVVVGYILRGSVSVPLYWSGVQYHTVPGMIGVGHIADDGTIYGTSTSDVPAKWKAGVVTPIPQGVAAVSNGWLAGDGFVESPAGVVTRLSGFFIAISPQGYPAGESGSQAVWSNRVGTVRVLPQLERTVELAVSINKADMLLVLDSTQRGVTGHVIPAPLHPVRYTLPITPNLTAHAMNNYGIIAGTAPNGTPALAVPAFTD